MSDYGATVRTLFTASLAALAARRPIFHSEADFQHALAWQLQLDHPDARIRLETVPLTSPRVHLDLAFTLGDRTIAAELKYLSRALDAEVDGERFSLRAQAAQDVRRYDVVKDIHRLEVLVLEGAADAGIAVVLSNDAGYWSKGRIGTVDESFRLHDGRTLAGTLAWAGRTGAGTMAKRETPVVLEGRYDVQWVPFSTVGAGPAGEFRSLLVHVDRAGLTGTPAPAAPNTAVEAVVAHAAEVGPPEIRTATCREQILRAFDALERAHARREFSPAEVLAEVRRRGGTHKDSTIRTHITSAMCVNAAANHAVRYPDLERTGSGLYRRLR